jgi:ribosomal peptide maturation radical SAM protein 1
MNSTSTCISRTPGQPSVLLVSMPWAPLLEPSLGLAILKAQLRDDGISATIRHLNLFLLRYFKQESYERIALLYAFNDFLFSGTIDSQRLDSQQVAELQKLARNTCARADVQLRIHMDPQAFYDYAIRARVEVIPAYLDDCVKAVDETTPTMVGFTCMYDQTLASLALARLVKRRYPEKLVVFGGYALERPVGPQLMHSFSFIDVVVFGEGEDRITQVACASVDRTALPDIPGIMYREIDGRVRTTSPSRSKTNLDESPVPDYDDFVDDVARLDKEEQVEITFETLPVESSRGCWWGQVSHCTFCGIDDDSMRYRYKSAEKVESMLEFLQNRYGPRYFRFSDYILPRQYFKTLLPKLAQTPSRYRLHWEMKSNVKDAEVQLMSKAGVMGIQPGIESFASSVLKKMDKGVTGIQNVLTIKLLMQNDITVHYNILYGFVDDVAEEYQEMCENIPSLYHLYPPFSYAQVLTTRYSPMQADPARFGITEAIVSEAVYDLIFSQQFREETGFKNDDYCYIFKTPYGLNNQCIDLYGILVYQIHHWIAVQASRPVQLSYELIEDYIEFVDSRFQSQPKVTTFSADHARIYREIACNIMSTPQLVERFCEDLTELRVQEIVSDFLRERLIFKEGARVTGLALPIAWYRKWAAGAASETHADTLVQLP